MPTLPVYLNTKNVSPGPAESSAYSLERYGRVNQESIQQAGEGLAGAAQAYQKHVARSEVMDWQAQASQFELQQEQAYQAKRLEAGTDTSWVKGFLDDYQGGLSDLSKKLTTPEAQDFANARQSEMAQQFGRRMYAEAASTEIEGQITAAHTTVQNYANLAAGAPERAGELADTASHAAMLVPGPGRDKEIAGARAAVFDSALEGILGKAERDPFITQEKVQKIRDYLKDNKNGYVGNAESPGASEKAYAGAIQRLDALDNYAAGTPQRMEQYRASQEAHTRAEEKAASEQQGSDIFSKSILVRANGSVSIDPQGIANALAIPDREVKQSVFDALVRLSHEPPDRPVVADGSTLQHLEKAVVDRQLDLPGLFQMVGTTISIGQYNFLKPMVDNLKSEEGRLANQRLTEIVQSAKTQFGLTNNGGVGVSPAQQKQFDQWHSWFLNEFGNRIQKGEDQKLLLGMGQGPGGVPGKMEEGINWQGMIDRIKGTGTTAAGASAFDRYKGIIQNNTSPGPVAPVAPKKPLAEFMQGQ